MNDILVLSLPQFNSLPAAGGAHHDFLFKQVRQLSRKLICLRVQLVVHLSCAIAFVLLSFTRIRSKKQSEMW